MTLLKLKSKFYRYTGIYLAHKEENDYLTSRKTVDKLIRLVATDTNSLAPYDHMGLLVGSWQAKHGFSRPLVIRRHFSKYRIIRIIGHLQASLEAIWYDIQGLFRT